MKKEVRILGIDDSPFKFSDKFTRIIGVIMRTTGYIEGVLSNQVLTDGNDATTICIDMIRKTRHKQQIKLIMLDGVAFGGFNIVDINKIYSSIELPIITITRDKPDFNKIKNALKKKFLDWEDRWNVVSNGELFKVSTMHNPIYIKIVGLSIDEAKEIIKNSTIRGVIPEPIRIAHLIASGVSRGESYGKA